MPRAREVYATNCEKGDGDSCINAAILWEEGKGGPTDQAKADAFTAKACTYGVPDACN